MTTRLGRAARRRRLFAVQFAGRAPAGETRHPIVALAMVLPCAVLLLALFGGWEELAAETRAVADLIGR